jgi:AcrR family transcriptional regulator
MVVEEAEKRRRGRPAGEAAVSHERILDAVQSILTEKSVRDLTMEEVARRADVGKPTIYKWWPSKAALVLDMFEERLVGALDVPEAKTAEEAIRGQVAELIRMLNGFFGKVARELIGEGQGDASVLTEYRDRYLSKRRAFSAKVIERAKQTGELDSGVDAELLIDMVYGPIYYRLLLDHAPLNQEFGTALVDNAISCAKTSR